jgi:hypothetical protein
MLGGRNDPVHVPPGFLRAIVERKKTSGPHVARNMDIVADKTLTMKLPGAFLLMTLHV